MADVDQSTPECGSSGHLWAKEPAKGGAEKHPRRECLGHVVLCREPGCMAEASKLAF